MEETVIPPYPHSAEITLGLRPLLHPMFKRVSSGISEFTFANIYLFRQVHNYRAVTLPDGTIAILGQDVTEKFFMLPFGVPGGRTLERLFKDFAFMKNASEKQAAQLQGMGYRAWEDRDNFDYVYSREELKDLTGRKFHRKKNLVNAFLGEYSCEGRPLLPEYRKDALDVLETWLKENGASGDYAAAKEAVILDDELSLCGGIYYVGKRPVAYALGEELKNDTFAVHFEKGVEGYKGLMQFVNRSFAEILPEKYAFINREQDLGDEGLRQAKLSYRPSAFVKKYRVTAKASTSS